MAGVWFTLLQRGLFDKCSARGVLVLSPPWNVQSEMGALSALVTPVSLKGRQMQLVPQVDLSAVISVKNTKNKTLRGIVWVSQFSPLLM